MVVPDTHLSLTASTGRQWLGLAGLVGCDKGVVSGAMATTSGQTYWLRFDLGNYLSCGIFTLGVSIHGGAEQLFTNPSLAVTGTALMKWATFTTDWLADSSSATLSFVGRANGASSNRLVIGLDNVTFEPLSPLPEPGTWALWLGGLGGLGALSVVWRRRPGPNRA